SVAGWYGFAGDALVSSRAVTGGWLSAPVSRKFGPPLRKLDGVMDLQTLRVLQGQPYDDERIAVAGLSEGLLRQAVSQGSFVGSGGTEDVVRKLSAGEGAALSQNFVVHLGMPNDGV